MDVNDELNQSFAIVLYFDYLNALIIKKILNCFFEVVTRYNEIIVADVIKTEGLKSQYKRPKEKIIIKNHLLIKKRMIAFTTKRHKTL